MCMLLVFTGYLTSMEVHQTIDLLFKVRLPYEEGFFDGKNFKALRVTLGTPTRLKFDQRIPLNFTSRSNNYDLIVNFPRLRLPRYHKILCATFSLHFLGKTIAKVVLLSICILSLK